MSSNRSEADRSNARLHDSVDGGAASARTLGRAAVAAVAALTLLVAAPAAAQSGGEGGGLRTAIAVEESTLLGPATLEADEINYDPTSDIVRASGNVEVFYAGRILRADAIIYDARADRIAAQGEITVVNPDGSVIAADSASFDTELRDGLIRGARAVLSDGKSRIAAVEGRRIDGEVTSLSKAVYSPCHVCEDDPTPLWRIRARRIVHDESAKRISYEDATFEVAGVPVVWLPYFSHADPTVRRKSGFLTPSISSDDELGFGLSVAYYWSIASNRDLTLTAFGYTEENPVFAGEYRALETYGGMTLAGSATWSDDPFQRGFRGHFIGDGEFRLGAGWVTGFDVLVASDDTYLRRYDFGSTDRAEARGYVENFGEDGYLAVEAARYQSFREGEFAGSIPQILPHVDGERVFEAPLVGGQFVIGGDALWLQRTEGRDLGRVSASAAWERTFISEGGLVFDTTAKVRGDYYSVQDDVVIEDGGSGRFLPLGAMTVSYPLGLVTDSAAHVIEPIGVVVVAPYGGDDVTTFANEDSQDFELDELSIFSIERITGLDRWEEGPRATVGFRYIRQAFGDGVNIEVSLGQSFRLRESNVFSENSGLGDQISDFVGSWRIEDARYYSVGHRFRVSAEEGTLRRNEVYAVLTPFDSLRLSGSFIHIEADPAIDADEDRTEGLLNAEFDVTRYWTVSGSVRRDFGEARFVSAGGGIRYADECIEVSFSVARRFNSVEDAPASTKFDFTVKLLGVEGY